MTSPLAPSSGSVAFTVSSLEPTVTFSRTLMWYSGWRNTGALSLVSTSLTRIGSARVNRVASVKGGQNGGGEPPLPHGPGRAPVPAQDT